MVIHDAACIDAGIVCHGAGTPWGGEVVAGGGVEDVLAHGGGGGGGGNRTVCDLEVEECEGLGGGGVGGFVED